MRQQQLAQYRRRRTEDEAGQSFDCKLINADGGRAILKLPDRRKRPDVPTGEVEVTLRDGTVWLFRFAKEYCNVAHPAGGQQNKLTDLLRSWFGPAAGRPGTDFRVRFAPLVAGLGIEPVGVDIVPLPLQRRIPAFPSFEAAAGFEGPQSPGEDVEWLEVPIEGSLDGLLAVRARGDSMDGGPKPIRDGEWLVIRTARGAPITQWLDRVCLFELPEANEQEARFVVKRLKRDGATSILAADNPTAESRPAPPGANVIGVVVLVLPADA